MALRLSYQGRLVWVLPPTSRINAMPMAISPGTRVAALIIPGKLVRTLGTLVEKTGLEIIVVYGSIQGGAITGLPPGTRCLHTGEGAVGLKISANGIAAEQWRP